jgi:signal transduction histidine kinase/ActR/RegA family two-component response regulator
MLFAQDSNGTLEDSATGSDTQNLNDKLSTNPLADTDRQLAIKKKIDVLNKAFKSKNPIAIHEGYHLLGYDYLAIKDTILARESFEKSEKFARQSNNQAALALSYNDLANFYSEGKKEYETSFDYRDKAITIYKKLNDTTGLKTVYYDNIHAAMDAKKYRTVYSSIIKARKLQVYDEITPSGISLDYLLAEYYSKKGKYDMANTYFEKAISAAETEGFNRALENAYGYYFKSLKKENKIAEAFDALTKYEALKDKNRTDINSSQITALASKFQLAEYRKDVALAERENEYQSALVGSKSRINKILIGVAACFLILLFALLFVLSKRKILVQKLKDKNKEYLKAKREAEKLSKAKSKFFSTVSHELRTPLYGVIGMSTILLENESLKKHESDLKSLKFSADYLLALINDVLQLNKIDSKNVEEEHLDFNLKELINKITESFEYMRLKNSNEIHVHISDSVPTNIHGNSVRLSQVLMNLIGNACKFTENGNIYVIAETVKNTPTNTAIKFYIRDTGMGIPKEKLTTIFEEFSQLQDTNSKYRGTGLGLPIVKKLLQLSNSDIEVQSEFGKGSMFTFTIDFGVASEQTVAVLSGGDLDVNILKGKRILIVEDNRINQTVTKKILEKNHIDCVIAENGLQAVECVRKDIYDLILMDINMPVMNGMDATKEIRTFNKSIPIVALTAVEVEEMRMEIMNSGMNDIVVKPYDVTKFIQTILKNIVEPPSPKTQKSSRLRAV